MLTRRQPKLTPARQRKNQTRRPRRREGRELGRDQGFAAEDMRERGEVGLEDRRGQEERSAGPKGLDGGAAELLGDDGERDAQGGSVESDDEDHGAQADHGEVESPPRVELDRVLVVCRWCVLHRRRSRSNPRDDSVDAGIFSQDPWSAGSWSWI